MKSEDLIDSGCQNPSLFEEMYARYLQDPTSVDASWRKIFGALDSVPESITTSSPESETSCDAWRLCNLIEAYRMYGHLCAKTNPLSTSPISEPNELSLEHLGFNRLDLSRNFPTHGFLKEQEAPLVAIVDALKATYCDKIGIEYMGLENPVMEKWLQQRIESNHFKNNFTVDQKRKILEYLNKSEVFESFLHTKYVGQKRFSLEGAETLIPMLATLLEEGTACGAEEYFIGMAHRGRLNVLCNIFNKSYADVFSEFDEGYVSTSSEGTGDVKYHKGFYSEVEIKPGKRVKVTLTPNPSHLEAVDGVVEGEVKARQILCNDDKQEKIIPILIHGDGALSGQGIVYETLQLSRLEGYSTGGTIHIVINNQIAFTTLPKDSRSTRYCTDIARAFEAPVFHVNAEDPEGCVYAVKLAIALRQKFHCDVFIDLNCYRKYGHNEGDEPFFTQPLEYQFIRKKKNIRELYLDTLIGERHIERQMADTLQAEFKSLLESSMQKNKISNEKKEEKKKENRASVQKPTTAVPLKTLEEVGQQMCALPSDLTVHPKIASLLKERVAMVKDGKPIDWGMGELLAYATLLVEKIDVRLSGQDSCRGTFSHRHASLVDQAKENRYVPLRFLRPSQGRFDVYNSSLSEYAVLGFEFGYSAVNLGALVIWEAQFGDFCNGAQIIIDQFIVASEQKWGQQSALTLFLPHGYEGQGPEHSSARMERFLSLAGHDNVRIVIPTTPVQLFHLLRRQALSSSRKPLIVFTPKALLRHPKCVSSLTDFTQGEFQEVLLDPNPPKVVRRLVFCTGRVFYDLIAEREKQGIDDCMIVRIEQLYPLDTVKIKSVIEKQKVKECLWVQEEPSNMGAWGYIRPLISELLPDGIKLSYVGREQSASTAVGSHATHKKELAEILEAFAKK